MTEPPTGEEMAALGLAARILLAHDDGDSDQVAHLVNTDPDAAVHGLIIMSGALAAERYGEQVRECLTSVATAADLDAIGREVTG